MDVTDRTTDRESCFAPGVHRGSLPGLSHLSLFLCLSVLAFSFLTGTVAAQDFLVLGQSPVGPLLDDEPGSWLDQVPDAASGEGISESVVDGSFAPTGPATSEGFYQEGAYGGEGMVGEMVQCPDCGSSLSIACPTCSPFAGGCLSPGQAGLAGLSGCASPSGWHDILQPMTQESWLYRPLSAGWFMGFMQGNELVEDWLGQGQGFFGGYRFGWDFDPYWGCEMRFGFASVALYDSDRAKAAQEAADIAAGILPTDSYYHRFDNRRDSGIRLWDVEMLWYPFGDTYFRPYFLLGLGSARVDFMDRLSERQIKSVLAMPIAIGFKYHLRDWLAVRVEATDNFIAGAGSGFKSLHNFSLTAGLEVRFGGTRTGYWPYYPGRHYW